MHYDCPGCGSTLGAPDRGEPNVRPAQENLDDMCVFGGSSAESLGAISEGDAFLVSGKEGQLCQQGRFRCGSDSLPTVVGAVIGDARNFFRGCWQHCGCRQVVSIDIKTHQSCMERYSRSSFYMRHTCCIECAARWKSCLDKKLGGIRLRRPPPYQNPMGFSVCGYYGSLEPTVNYFRQKIE